MQKFCYIYIKYFRKITNKTIQNDKCKHLKVENHGFAIVVENFPFHLYNDKDLILTTYILHERLILFSLLPVEILTPHQLSKRKLL